MILTYICISLCLSTTNNNIIQQVYTYTGESTSSTLFDETNPLAPLYGESCAIQTFTSQDDTSSSSSGMIGTVDDDSCHDVTITDSGGNDEEEKFTSVLQFKNKFTIPCTDYSDSDDLDELELDNNDTTPPRTVKLQFCSSFTTADDTSTSCDIVGPTPNQPTNCYCDMIDLGIEIVRVEDAVPTCTPSVYTLDANDGVPDDTPPVGDGDGHDDDNDDGCGDKSTWHYDPDEALCTNDEPNPDAPGVPTTYDSKDNCCEANFPNAGTPMGKECMYYDVCELTVVPTTVEPTVLQAPSPTTTGMTPPPVTSPPAGSPRVTPPPVVPPPPVGTPPSRPNTPSPTTIWFTPTTQTSAPTSCDDRVWHYGSSVNNGGICTNAVFDNMPSSVGYESLDECCDNFGDDEACVSVDVCTQAPPNPPTTNDVPTTPRPNPPTTNDVPTTPPPVPKPTFEPSSFEPTPCVEMIWHYTDGVCTNSNDRSPVGTVYENAMQCCEDNFEPDTDSGDLPCTKNDICDLSPDETPPITDSPTRQPTRKPVTPPVPPSPQVNDTPDETPRPTPQTNNPTKQPTPKPTPKPTVDRKYQSSSVLICSCC